MDLTLLSSTGFWLGALALAGGVFALQRLRVRHREVVVPTTLFWRAALEETRARTLTERFRHPLTFLLLLAIALLGWLSFAAPVADRDDGAEHLFLLDLSAPMASTDGFDGAVRALRAEVARSDRDHRRVVAVGAGLVTLLAPGEDLLELDERLAALEPDGSAPGFERALLVLTGDESEGERPLDVALVGRAGVRDRILELLPDDVSVERIAFDAGPDAARILDVACGPSPSAAEQAGFAVDVWVRTNRAAADVRVLRSAANGPGRAPDRVESTADRGQVAKFTGLLADGRVLEFALGANERAALALPDRRALRVAADPAALPGALALALRSHAGVRLVAADAEADVVVRAAGSDLRRDLPALELSDPAGGDAAFVLVESDEEDRRTALFTALGDLGLEWIDGQELAEATQREIAFASEVGPTRALRLWRSLCATDGAFARDAAFPLVVARSLDWLAGREAPRYVARAGDGVRDARTAFVASSAGVDAAGARANGAALDPVGAAFVPPRAGLFRARDGAARAVLAAGPGYAPPAGSAPRRAAVSAPSSAFDLTNLVLLILGAGLVLEWFLVRRGRIA